MSCVEKQEYDREVELVSLVAEEIPGYCDRKRRLDGGDDDSVCVCILSGSPIKRPYFSKIKYD